MLGGRRVYRARNGVGMSDTWRSLFQRLAAGCLIAVISAWSGAACYAQVAFDSADDAAYSDGWQAGDDGGFGTFGPWSFSGTYASATQQKMDDGLNAGAVGSSSFNNLGKSWSLFNPAAGDFARAGRGIGALQVGQTLRITIDNPTSRQAFRGYSLKLNTGGGSVCTTGCTPGAAVKYKVERLENFDNGQWSDSSGHFGLSDTDTDAGARIDFILSSPTTYEMKITPLDNPAAAISTNGTLENPATSTPINWVEFQFFNTQTSASSDTDFFIKSMSILAAPPAVPGDYNRNGKVDTADYVVWRNRLGSNYQLFNEVPGVTPGTVTSDDYTAWRARFGNTSGAGAGGEITSSAVPEPGTPAYAMGVACVFVAGAKRSGRPSRP
jgi:hypothetical protein